MVGVSVPDTETLVYSCHSRALFLTLSGCHIRDKIKLSRLSEPQDSGTSNGRPSWSGKEDFIMSRPARIFLLVLPLLVVSLAHGFEASWTDQFGETTYMITGPDTVGVGDSVEVVINAEDPFYPNDMVAAPWSFLEDGMEEDGGFAVWLTGGVWEETYSFVYESSGSHTYTFTAQDLGHGNGGHSWEWFEIDGTTVVDEPSTTVISASSNGRRGSWGNIKHLFR